MSRPPNFDRLAGIYRWMELASFGPWLWRCRCAFLGELGQSRRALILGDGDGRFTACLLRTNPDLQIDAVDVSAAMLRALVRRAGRHATRVRTYAADARQWKPSEPIQVCPYDLVVTHFFLDCLTTAEVRALAAMVRPTLSFDAVWVVSEFAVPVGWFGRFIARPLIWLLYWAFGWMTGLAVRRLPNHRAALEQAGFKLQFGRQWLCGLLVSELWRANSAK